MSIRIKGETCIGCGRCVEACPGNLIKLRDRDELTPGQNVAGEGAKAPCCVAEMRHPRDCWGCTSCLKACPAGAIEFFLGADMGGTGAVLSFSRTGTVSHWAVTKPDGSEVAIDVDGANANKY